MGEWFDKFFRGLSLLLFLAIVAAGLVTTFPKYSQVAALERAHANLEQRIAEKRREVEAVKEMKVRFAKDRDFVEALARENRRVFPGEIVFIFDK